MNDTNTEHTGQATPRKNCLLRPISEAVSSLTGFEELDEKRAHFRFEVGDGEWLVTAKSMMACSRFEGKTSNLANCEIESVRMLSPDSTEPVALARIPRTIGKGCAYEVTLRTQSKIATHMEFGLRLRRLEASP